MTYLVDVNVLSEPTKSAPNAKVVDWLVAHEEDFVIDPIILGELCMGILALPPGRKRTQLEQWFADVVEATDCVPWDAAVSRRWATLVAALQRKGETLPVLDGMIAATALTHGLIVATRNVRDFKKAGAKVVDPFV